jgi:membrane-bound lytic murein transglycosylase A
MIDAGVSFEPATFADLKGWAEDDHLAALQAFRRSCPKLGPAADLTRACAAAAVEGAEPWSRARARAFFEAHFRPHRVVHRAGEGLLTGYYEPEIAGARVRGEAYTVPVYRRPPDLENLVAEAQRGAKADSLTHARRTAAGLEPYATRAEIDQGALAGHGLELAYVRCPVDLFFMQVQGSGVIRLPDGAKMRVTYDGKNGHPYTSIGRYLVDAGELPPEPMSLEILAGWLRQDLVRAAPVMWQNASYVFFREIPPSEAEGPLGVEAIPLTAGRSLAVDAGTHALGTPIWVSSPSLTHATDATGFHRLMIAQDVGSAIRGPERGDIFFGSGAEAGRLAGITRHAGRFFVLLPA